MQPASYFAIFVLVAIFFWGASFFVYRVARFRKSLKLIHLRVLIPKKSFEISDREDVTKGFKEQIALFEQLLLGLKSLYSKKLYARFFGQEAVSLEFISHKNEISFHIVLNKKNRALVEKQIVAFYPEAVIEVISDTNIFSGRFAYSACQVYLDEGYVFPVKTYQKLDADPMTNILSALSKTGANESAVLQFLIKPTGDGWQKKASKAAQKLQKKGFSHFSWNPLSWIMSFVGILLDGGQTHKDAPSGHEKSKLESELYESIDEKSKKAGYASLIRVVTTGATQDSADAQLHNICASFAQFSAPNSNRFKYTWWHSAPLLVRDYIYRYFSPVLFTGKTILSTEEIASIFHFPHSKYNRIPEIRWQNFKIVKAPTNISAEEGILLGENVFRGERQPIRIKTEDRFRHFYVIGQTGTGKTSILQVMARQDLALGNGLAVIDPHGDLANDLMPFIPKSRASDVVYFNPGDTERPMGLNLLEASSPDEKEVVAQEALNIMIKLFGNEIFGPRIQDYFRNGVLTLMDFPGGGALTDIVRLFTDDAFQKERVAALKNPIVKAWWLHTFANMGDREKAEMIPYFAAKFGGFITNSLMRNIIGQTKSSFDVFDCMNSQKILLINLSKGILGDQNSQLLGLIIVSKIQAAAMRRQKQDKAARKDFFLYIDEFQNYITDSIESILSEARKYRLGLVVAHQYLGQLQKNDALTKSNVNLKDAIFGNVGTIMSYKIGPEDGEFLEKQMSPNFTREDLINMDKFKAVMKLSVDGQPTPAFSIIPKNPYLEKGDLRAAKVMRELSRTKYGRMREHVEGEIIFRIGS